jgi:hypothetical protein
VKGLLAQLRLVFEAPVEHAEPPALVAPAAPMAPRLVRHPRARQYVLRVLADGTPRVTIPRWGSKREALVFLEAQRDWVARQRAKLAEKMRAAPSCDWRDGHTLLLDGQPIALRRGSTSRAQSPRPGCSRGPGACSRRVSSGWPPSSI